MPDVEFVNQPDLIVARLTAVSRIAVDTEFMREKTFFAELCLVQVATADHIFCIDPLTPHDNQAFWNTLMAKYWVLHSARQDIEVVYQSAHLMPTGIFDTQIAAGLLGMPPQLGYAALVNELFDTEIDKLHTRANWSRRPLPEELLRYAAEDVEYLLPAYDILAERLDKKGRLGWAQQDSASLLEPALYAIDPNEAILRLKGAVRLRGRSRAAATRLAAWRESEALSKNLPRQWIVRDRTLLELACKLPTRIEALADIGGLAPGTVRRTGKKILEIIADSAADPDDYLPPSSPDERQRALLKEAQKLVTERAGHLNLAVDVIATRKDLTAAIVAGDRRSRLFHGWRRSIIGEDLLELLARN